MTRQMRSWNRLLLALVISIGLLLGLSVAACGSPKTLTVTDTYSIEHGEKRVISVLLHKGDRLDLSVTVASNDIGVQVNDPNGNATVAFTRVESGSFVVKATIDGTYTVILDNSYSWSTSKSVTFVLKYPER